ncbi:MAG: CinA family nicotinamide mononucleotide deamidase-related protein [Bacteroidales bacterium]|nr:CinA family nicotinamide mononucleotide deamidase-related protein [Bacteroidales bacterium]
MITGASIVTIGDEILIGQIVDTNSAMISRRLGGIGVRTLDMISIPDDREQIISRLSEELKRSDVVISTGGLGPTKDDITKDALATLFGSRAYVRHEAQEEQVRVFLHSRGLDVLDINLAQADVPEGCDVIVNRRGTAPIMVFRFDESRFGHPATLYAMPGVPYETEAALDEVMEDIRRHFHTEDICHRHVMVYGLAESALSKLIEKWESSLPSDMHLAYLPGTLAGVRLRLSVYGGEKSESEARMDAEIARLLPILGDRVYSLLDEPLEAVVGRLLREAGATLSAAESCTGGQIAHMITTVSGASDYFLGSVTSYSPEIKKKVLGVPASVIEENGIVSSAVAAAMAEGVRALTGSTFSVATTGWADAYGDEREPAGTVWVGVSGPAGTETARFHYHNDRKRNIERFSASAIDFLRRYIIKHIKH